MKFPEGLENTPFNPSRVFGKLRKILLQFLTRLAKGQSIALSKLFYTPFLRNLSYLGPTNIKYIPTSPILISFMMRQRHLWSGQYGQDLWNLGYKGVIDPLDFDTNS